ncbi:MAG: hypothetical protein V7K40_14160 [Nostoc sp.]|uniref:hypothetical protein n=1 Tax=Nostoc sp. TaxID=1180 RepID=UPI002FF7A64C
MPTHNNKEHLLQEGKEHTILLRSKHLGDVVEIHIDKEKKCFYGVKEDGNIVEYYPKSFSDFKCAVVLYKIHYSFEENTWVMGYTLKKTNEDKWMLGFATAREAWLYREALISASIAKR